METKEIDLTKCKGFCFKASIYEAKVEGKLQVENGNVYLCQNEIEGSDCEDKLGFQYSWQIPNGSKEAIEANSVIDFEIIPRDPETYKDWQVGDIIGCEDENGDIDIMADHLCRVIFRSGELRVIFRSGELVAIAENYSAEEADINGCYTCSQLFRECWRLVLTDIERQIIEERKKWEPQDGDICYAELISDWVFIKKDGEFLTENYAALRLNDGYTNFDNPSRINNDAFVKMIRIATDEDKQKLFDAMAKKGKRWNAEKKVVEDIPKPYEFKKGEPVLVRRDVDENWRVRVYLCANADNTYRHKVTSGNISENYQMCIPYNERTMHLLGTTEDYKEEQR